MYEWSPEDLMVRDALRAFIDKEIRPHSDELESGRLAPYDILRKLLSTFGVDQMAEDALAKELAAEEARAAGDTGAGSRSRGGASAASGGMSQSAFIMLNCELSSVSLGLVTSLGVSMGLTSSTIRSRGTLAQKKRWLPGLVSLGKIGSWAITEPDSGSDALGGMKTTVRRDGDDYILNGQKTFITNGPYADIAVVFAKLDDGSGTPPRERKVLTFVVEKGMPGFTQGSPFKKMGLMTVEGEKDDICSVGQTLAAQDLCSGLWPNRKRHHLQAGVGHYGVFSGRRWQQQIYPIVRSHILAND